MFSRTSGLGGFKIDQSVDLPIDLQSDGSIQRIGPGLLSI